MFTNNYDIIILGGGISGLYLAYELSKTGKTILLIEKTNRYGGRMYTEERGDITYECGAARFHSTHTNLIKLLDELDFNEK